MTFMNKISCFNKVKEKRYYSDNLNCKLDFHWLLIDWLAEVQ